MKLKPQIKKYVFNNSIGNGKCLFQVNNFQFNTCYIHQIFQIASHEKFQKSGRMKSEDFGHCFSGPLITSHFVGN